MNGSPRGIVASMNDKLCGECGETKPAGEFYAGRRVCKACVRAKNGAHRAANLDRVRATDRARSKERPNTAAKARYRERNRDEINAKRRAARAADPEAVRAKDRAAYLANPTARAAASRRWKKSNPERLALYDARRRARHAGALLGPVNYDVVRASRSDCYLCGQKLFGDVHLDHIVPLARYGAHCTDNLRPTHAACNLRKSDRLLAELAWYNGPTDLGVTRPAGPES